MGWQQSIIHKQNHPVCMWDSRPATDSKYFFLINSKIVKSQHCELCLHSRLKKVASNFQVVSLWEWVLNYGPYFAQNVSHVFHTRKLFFLTTHCAFHIAFFSSFNFHIICLLSATILQLSKVNSGAAAEETNGKLFFLMVMIINLPYEKGENWFGLG